MKVTGGLLLALAAAATAASSSTLSTKGSACKLPSASSKRSSAVSVSSGAASRSGIPSGVSSVKPVSSSASSGKPVSSGVSSGKPASSGISSGKPVSSGVSSGKPASSGVSSGRPASSGVSSGRGSASRASASGTGKTTCVCPLQSACPPSSGSNSGAPTPTTISSCNPSASPIPPKQDPWYSAPAGFENAKPGDVLKVRNACGLVPIITNSSAAYNILYRTTNSQYGASWAVTTLLVPVNTTNNLLSYQIPYDSADLDSSPSYSLYGGGGVFGDSDITQALGRGLYVLTPDYEGPNASFTAGVTSGHATLDSLRSAISANSPVQLNTATYALWGYSGGALASEWGLELQNQYAPELNIAGAALGGLTPNVTSVLLTINGTIYAGLAPSGILGLASQYPDAMAYLEGQLFQTGDYNATRFNAALNYTLVQSIGAFAGQDISKYFMNGFGAIESPVAQKVINRDGIMGYHGVPQPPIFAYKAIGDDISVIADTDALVARYCGVGATINYQRNTVGNHNTELTNGIPRAVAFLTSIFDGTYSATGCQITNVTVTA